MLSVLISQVGDYFNAYPDYILTIFDKVLERKVVELTASGHNQPRMRKTFHTRVTGQTSSSYRLQNVSISFSSKILI